MRSAIGPRVLVSLLAAGVLAIGLGQFAADPVLGQSAPGVNAVSAAPTVPLHNPSLPHPGPPPRNADGHPDLNGVWDFSVATPLQRSTEFGDTLFLSPEEAAAYQQSTAGFDRDTRTSNVEEDAYSRGMNAAWFDLGNQPLAQNRTSLIVDPPDGQRPPLTPGAEASMARCAGIYECGMQGFGPKDEIMDLYAADHVTDRSIAERCLMIADGPPIEVFGYNNNLHILHRDDVVVIQTEMIHTARVVWLDGRPQPDAAVRQWHGYSRGHWEEDTLVIETTNFRADARWLSALNPENVTLVERLTRIDQDTVLYEYTMNDPETWTRPWTVQLPMTKLDGFMYEYACHEGNYALKFQLMASRARDTQEAAEEAK